MIMNASAVIVPSVEIFHFWYSQVQTTEAHQLGKVESWYGHKTLIAMYSDVRLYEKRS